MAFQMNGSSLLLGASWNTILSFAVVFPVLRPETHRASLEGGDTMKGSPAKVAPP